MHLKIQSVEMERSTSKSRRPTQRPRGGLKMLDPLLWTDGDRNPFFPVFRTRDGLVVPAGVSHGGEGVAIPGWSAALPCCTNVAFSLNFAHHLHRGGVVCAQAQPHRPYQKLLQEARERQPHREGPGELGRELCVRRAERRR